MTNRIWDRPGSRWILPVLAVTVLGGCDLAVDPDPSLVDARRLEVETALRPRLLGVQASIYDAFGGAVALYGSMFGDETVFGSTPIEQRAVDLRDVDPLNVTANNGIYAPLQEAAFLSKTLQADILEGDFPSFIQDPQNSAELALTSMVSGYARLFIGELFCSSAFNNEGPEYQSDEVLQLAIDEFTLAIDARNASAKVRNAALVGRARAHLDLGHWDAAVTDARRVTEGFEYFVEFSGTDGNVNPLYGTITSFRGASVAPEYRVMTIDDSNVVDPRVDNIDLKLPTYGGQTETWTPSQGATRSSPIRFSSWDEAQLIIAEVRLDEAPGIINRIRTAHGISVLWDAAGASQSEIAAKVRDERLRTLFMEGQRVGDLRRYQEFYDLDLWPDNGPQGGGQTCIPLPDWERNYNPGL